MNAHLTPLEVCRRLFGSLEALALDLGYSEKAPYNWRHASDKRDAGDLPSAKIMRRVLQISKGRGLGLTARHLVEGATEEEVASILAARNPIAAPSQAPIDGQAVAA
jgi:hypothetical protein